MRKAILILMAITALTSCKKRSFEEQILQDIKHFNEKEAPKRLDQYTIYDSIQYDVESNTISMFYTIETDLPAQMFPQQDLDNFRQDRLKALRSSIQYKVHKEHNCNFRYVYYLQKSKETLIDCTFSKEDYR